MAHYGLLLSELPQSGQQFAAGVTNHKLAIEIFGNWLAFRTRLGSFSDEMRSKSRSTLH